MRSPRIGSAFCVIKLVSSTFRATASAERNSTVSRATSLRSRLFSSKGAFVRRLLILRMTSLARRSSCKISFTISLSSAISGLDDCRIAAAVSALVRIEPSGWFDFVSNRGGQFASGREPVDMRKFCHALPGLYFGQATPTMRIQQGRDKSGLQEYNGDDQRDLPRITLPCRWLPKQDLAPWWQATRADVPALKLSPIVFRC